jgi:hypothetical protein
MLSASKKQKKLKTTIKNIKELKELTHKHLNKVELFNLIIS